MGWQNSTKFTVPRKFPSESTLGPEGPRFQPEDVLTDPGTLQWNVPEANEQYPGSGLSCAADSAVCDLDNTTDAAGYNAFHQPSTSGQRGGAD